MILHGVYITWRILYYTPYFGVYFIVFILGPYLYFGPLSNTLCHVCDLYNFDMNILLFSKNDLCFYLVNLLQCSLRMTVSTESIYPEISKKNTFISIWSL